MLLYLAGAINGCTDEECKDWREYVKSQVGEENTLDPMRRDYRGIEMDCVEEIVDGDKLDIDLSTHLLVYFDKPSVGTSMEILYAWEIKKPVIVVTPKETKLSPWLIYHSDKVFNTFEEAIEYFKNNNSEDGIFDKKLQAIKERSGMNIKSGRVMMEVKDRDWLFATIEKLLFKSGESL